MAGEELSVGSEKSTTTKGCKAPAKLPQMIKLMSSRQPWESRQPAAPPPSLTSLNSENAPVPAHLQQPTRNTAGSPTNLLEPKLLGLDFRRTRQDSMQKVVSYREPSSLQERISVEDLDKSCNTDSSGEHAEHESVDVRIKADVVHVQEYLSSRGSGDSPEGHATLPNHSSRPATQPAGPNPSLNSDEAMSNPRNRKPPLSKSPVTSPGKLVSAAKNQAPKSNGHSRSTVKLPMLVKKNRATSGLAKQSPILSPSLENQESPLSPLPENQETVLSVMFPSTCRAIFVGDEIAPVTCSVLCTIEASEMDNSKLAEETTHHSSAPDASVPSSTSSLALKPHHNPGGTPQTQPFHGKTLRAPRQDFHGGIVSEAKPFTDAKFSILETRKTLTLDTAPEADFDAKFSILVGKDSALAREFAQAGLHAGSASPFGRRALSQEADWDTMSVQSEDIRFEAVQPGENEKMHPAVFPRKVSLQASERNCELPLMSPSLHSRGCPSKDHFDSDAQDEASSVGGQSGRYMSGATPADSEHDWTSNCDLDDLESLSEFDFPAGRMHDLESLEEDDGANKAAHPPGGLAHLDLHFSIVVNWLRELGMPQLAPVFRRNRISLLELATATDQQLKDLGVNKMGVRAKLLRRAKAECLLRQSVTQKQLLRSRRELNRLWLAQLSPFPNDVTSVAESTENLDLTEEWDMSEEWAGSEEDGELESEMRDDAVSVLESEANCFQAETPWARSEAGEKLGEEELPLEGVAEGGEEPRLHERLEEVPAGAQLSPELKVLLEATAAKEREARRQQDQARMELDMCRQHLRHHHLLLLANSLQQDLRIDQ